jgi:hypothetical protein
MPGQRPSNSYPSGRGDNQTNDYSSTTSGDPLGDTRLREIADNYVPRALDKLEDGVATVRRLTTDRAVAILGYVIFGLSITIAGLAVVLCLLLLTIRLADVYGPGPLWAWYLGFSGVFLVSGVLLWRRSSPR